MCDTNLVSMARSLTWLYNNSLTSINDQHDSALARMLFSILYESVFVQVDTMLTEREAEDTKKAVRDGLNMVMEKSVQFHPPFIGSLQVYYGD